ncbi:MAG: LysE family transporter [Flavobacteriales bacterium]|nr:LysE family transporter [Flavobacteriales bacterium]
MAFPEGLLIGLGMIIFLGPVFFTLLKSSLQHGFRAGFSVATGIMLSDVTVLLMCYFGAASFFENPDNQLWLALVGSVVLAGIGLRYLLKKRAGKEQIGSIQAQDYPAFLIKGFLVNFVNPFVFVVWIGLVGMAQTKYGSGRELWLFTAGIIVGIYATDLTKVIFAHRITRFVRPEILTKAYRIIGMVLLVFAVRLLWYAYGQL